jgi:DNA-binding beta-propeller fold protein YncE
MRTPLVAATTLLLSGVAFAADGLTFKKVKDLALPGASGFDLLSADAPSRRLFVSHSTRIEVVDLDKGEKIGAVEGLEGAHMAVLAPDLKRGFASEGKKNKVVVFDSESYKATKEIDTGEGPDALLYVTVAKEVWVMNHKGGTITCVDAASLEVKTTIDVGGKLELASEYVAKGLVFVNVEDKSTVVSIDATKHAVVSRYPLDPATEPTGIAIDEKNGILFCGCAEKLAILDAASGKVLATLPIGAHCDSVVFDAEKGLVFASCGDGTTAVVHEADPKTFDVVAKIETAPGGKTCALDAKTHMLWVASGTRGKDDLRVLEFAAEPAK